MPAVFISYRQTDEQQRARVRQLGQRLRSAGLEVRLDQFYLDQHPGGPNEGWDKWSSDCALLSERVLIVGTRDWFECYDKRQAPGTGLGAACEADDLRHRIYEAGGIIEGIRVVLFDDADAQYIPAKLRRYHRFHVERDFDSVLLWVASASETPATGQDQLQSGSPSAMETDAALPVGVEAVRATIDQYSNTQQNKKRLTVLGVTVTILGLTMTVGITFMRPTALPQPTTSVEVDRTVDYSDSTCFGDGRRYNLSILDILTFSTDLNSYTPLAVVQYPTNVRLYDVQQASNELLPKAECKETNDKLPPGKCARATYEWPQGAVVRNRTASLRWVWTATEPVRFRNVDTKTRYPITQLRLRVTMPSDSRLTEPPVLGATGGRCSLVSQDVRGFVAECQTVSPQQPMHDAISVQLPKAALDCLK